MDAGVDPDKGLSLSPISVPPLSAASVIQFD